MTNGPSKVQDENRTVRQIKNEKNIVPPVAQFRAFSVYEDKPTEAEVKKREPFKFGTKEIKKDNFFKNAAENVKAICAQVEKQPDWKKDAQPKRLVTILAKIPSSGIFFYRVIITLHFIANFNFKLQLVLI